MVLVTFAVGFLFQKLANNKSREIDSLTPKLNEQSHKMELFKSAYGKMRGAKTTAEGIAQLMEERYYWGDFVSELRRALVRSEDAVRKANSAQKPGLDVGIWIEQMSLGVAATPGEADAAPAAPAPVQTDATGLRHGRGVAPVAQAQPDQTAQATASNTNGLTLVCRAVSLKKTVNDSANNKDIAYAVRDQIAASPMVDPGAAATQLVGEISADDANGTFTFTVTVTPLKPLKF
jgi:hypothetical protein